MRVTSLALYFTLLVFIFCYESSLLYYFFGVICLYFLISVCFPGAQSLSIRRKLASCQWPPPSDGLIYNRIPLRVDTVLKFIQSYPEGERPTLNHFIIKACGEVLKANPHLNGKLIFGKFVPYRSIDVSCLVDIDGGNDVGMVLVRDVASKSVEDICKFVRRRGRELRPEGGDETHKKRMGPLKFMPAVMVAWLYDFIVFVTWHLNVNLPAMGLERDSLGAMIVTPVGSMGFRDAFAPFFRSTGQWMIMTVNAAHQ